MDEPTPIDRVLAQYPNEPVENIERYLVGSSGNATLALERITERERLKQLYGVYDTNLLNLQPELFFKRAYIHYHSKRKAPLFILTPGNHYPKESNRTYLVQLVVHMIDYAINHLMEHETTFDCIVDMGSISRANADLEGIKTAYHYMEVAYPERLGQLYFVNSGFLFRRVLWPIVHAFLDQDTASKMHFVKDVEELHEFIDPQHIPRCYGGTSDYDYQPEANSTESHLDIGVFYQK